MGRMSPDGDQRVSLHGLDPEEALRALLAVDPDAPPVDEDDRASDGRHDGQDDEEAPAK